MSENARNVALAVIVVMYRVICFLIALFAALSGVWWFALVMIGVAMLATLSVPSSGPAPGEPVQKELR